jgi:hypothetical protein
MRGAATIRDVPLVTRQKPAPSHEQAVEEIVFAVIYAGNEADVMNLRGTLLEIYNHEALSRV